MLFYMSVLLAAIISPSAEPLHARDLNYSLTDPDLSPPELLYIEDMRRRNPEIVLYGGRLAAKGEFEPSVNIGGCTGTIVGPQVLLTAAHCRKTGSSISFRLKGQLHQGSCRRHPQYSQGAWLNNDFTLCKFSPEARLENYGDLTPQKMKVGDLVTLQGYGKGSSGGLHYGQNIIVRMNNMDIFTNRTTLNPTLLGSGDSGGALFSQVKDRVKGPFFVIGVNSRGSKNASMFNITALPRSQEFFKDFADKNSVEICGINTDCTTPIDESSHCVDERGILTYHEEELHHAKYVQKVCLAQNVLTHYSERVLINGRVAKEGEFPEVVNLRLGNSGCTGTFIGPQVVITAAHCGSHGGPVRFSLAGETHNGTCYRHPAYPRNDVDIMACKLTKAVHDLKMATVSGPPELGDTVTIAGYGCTQPGGGGGSDGKLRVGNAQVTGWTTYDVVSSKGVALCFGDSGGPMFRALENPEEEPHYIIAVNSKGNIRDTNYNTRLDLETSQTFLKNFEKSEGVEICGLSIECDTELKPKHCAEETIQVRFIEKKIKEAKDRLDKCLLRR